MWQWNVARSIITPRLGRFGQCRFALLPKVVPLRVLPDEQVGADDDDERRRGDAAHRGEQAAHALGARCLAEPEAGQVPAGRGGLVGIRVAASGFYKQKTAYEILA